MSFILEALKKSEKQRTLGRVPTLDDVYHTPRQSRPGPPMWRLVVIVLMVAGVVAGLWLWSLNGSGVPTSVAPVADIDDIRSPTESSSVPQTMTSNPQTVQTSAESQDAAARLAAVEFYSLPPQEQQRLRQYQVDVISYSERSERRFAMINQRITREGDALSDQVQLLKIGPDKVMVSSGAYRVWLRP